jgi:hypothetical protein
VFYFLQEGNMTGQSASRDTYIDLRDVSDVDVSSLSKGHASGEVNKFTGIKLEKTFGNHDVIAN